MPNLNKTYNAARKDIKNEILSIIDTAMADTNSLDDVSKKIYSRRLNLKNLQFPLLWILPEPHTPEITGTRSEQHTFTFHFIAVIQDKTGDHEAAKEAAEDIVSRVYDLFVSDADNRRLNGNCHDTVPGPVYPSDNWAERKTLYWAAVELRFRVKRLAV